VRRVAALRRGTIVDDPNLGQIIQLQAGAYPRPLFCSTQAHFVGYVGRMRIPQSIRKGDTDNVSKTA